MDWTTRGCDWLVRRRNWLLAVAMLLTLIAWPISRRLAFDQSIESLYAPNNPHLVEFLRSKETFGGDEFLIVAYRDPELFDAEGHLTDAARDRLEQLSEKIAAVPGIDPDSIQSAADALRTPYGRSRIREFIEGVLVGADGETTAVVSRLQPRSETTTSRRETFRLIRELAAAHNPPAVVVGEPIQVHDMFRYVEEDGSTLGIASSVLLMLVIFILFRSLRWMVLPLAVVWMTLVWTKAILVLSRIQLSMVSSMLNSLVTIIGIATVMHLTVRFRELRQAGLDREEATRQSLRQLAVPVFWTVVTTAAGFAALLICSVTPVASFGLMMTLATMIVLPVSAMVLPGAVLLGRETQVPAEAPLEHRIAAGLERLTDAVDRRPVLVWLLSAAAMGFCLAGWNWLHVETDFSKNFRDKSPIVQALNFFEDHLGGAGTWEVNFPAPEKLTDEYLNEVRTLAAELNELTTRTTPDRLTKVVVLTDGLDLIPADLWFTRISLERRLRLLGAIQPEFAVSLYNSDAGRMRIMLRALERQPAEAKLQLIADVEAIARKRFPEAEVTGLFVLLANLVSNLLDDQLFSSLLATAAMVIMVWMEFKSLRLSLLLLIPNVVPIAAVIGVIGWLGMKLNIASAMIAAVAMGLTIDSSIMYIDAYLAARKRGLIFSEALHETHQGVGLAVVFSNVALVIGFSVLTLSHFVPLVYFGVLVSVAMVGGLIGNLVLLPLLLRLFARWEKHPAPAVVMSPVQAASTSSTLADAQSLIAAPAGATDRSPRREPGGLSEAPPQP